MNRANQQALSQSTNMILVNIRNAEINYFNSFFTNFGIQAGLIITIVLGCVSQVPGMDFEGDYTWTLLFWYGSTIAVIAGTHILICTVFLSVFGQGLALRGPLGSMVQARDGMVVEQEHILIVFVLMIIALTVACIGMYGVMMDLTSAIGCSVLSVLGMVGWYHYALRIYNRFKWNQDEVLQDDEDEAEDANNKVSLANGPTPAERVKQSSESSREKIINKRKKARSSRGMARYLPSYFTKSRSRNPSLSDRTVSHSSNNNNNPGSNNELSNSGRFSFRKSTNEGVSPRESGAVSVSPLQPYHSDNDSPGDSNGFVDEAALRNSAGNVEQTYVGGYLSVHTGKNRRILSKDLWQRRFFIVQGNLIFYYKDRASYFSLPNKPINLRPIDMAGYTLVAGTVEPPYSITLLPVHPDDIRKVWKFRCDTTSEFRRWVGIFSGTLSQHPSHSDAANADNMTSASNGQSDQNMAQLFNGGDVAYFARTSNMLLNPNRSQNEGGVSGEVVSGMPGSGGQLRDSDILVLDVAPRRSSKF